MAIPSRAEVWFADLNPPGCGHEQHGTRPVLVVSVDAFNHGTSGMAVILPFTSKDKGQPLHVCIRPPEGGVTVPSWIKCDDVRAVSILRLRKRWGTVTPTTMAAVEKALRRLLGL